MTDLAEKVRFLSEPEAYAGDVRGVDVRETHMSWVFLTEREVFKLKKPVTYPHLDFSTLEKRRANCEAEVRLNRDAYDRLRCEKELMVVPGATHLFEEAGALDEVIRAARNWFMQHLRVDQTGAGSVSA